MSQRTVLRCALFLLAGLSLLTLASAQTPDVIGSSPRRTELDKKAVVLRGQLQSPVKFNGFDDPETTYADVFKYLERAYGIAFDVNGPAFKEEEIDLRDTKVGREIPRMTDVSLATVLRKILERIPSASGAMCFPRGGVIEVTTVHAYRAEFYPNRPDGPFPPLAYAKFDKKPLDEALKTLAEDCDANILLDETHAAEKGKTPVTARLADVPLDTAVLLLADMAGLESVQADGVYYVTTKENAEALRKKLEKARPAKPVSDSKGM
jgi:hypothetical protein